ncbi:MAG: hypothetical protein A2018_03435 [Alphaproteobacteria bacterium GWF2_58_20]|nr:MAG: hypothetical protein A2018_03435 [Alphaproteobacteria bacterium GWF2_58_20]
MNFKNMLEEKMKQGWFWTGVFCMGLSCSAMAADEYMFIKRIPGFVPGATSGAGASIAVSPEAGEVTISDGVSPGIWKNFTVKNEGGQETGSISASLSNVDDFELDASACSTLLGGQSCALKVRLKASDNGSFAGELSILAAPGGFRKVMLAGTANGFTAMWCWGDNNMGQLGTGVVGTFADGTTFSSVPVRALAGSVGKVARMTTGSYSVCALNEAGKIWCWGSNNWGQLGNNTYSNSAVPTEVFDVGKTFVDVASYYEHVCALASDHSLWCWGFNQYGQLGTGSTTSTKVPVTVSGMDSGVTSVDAGYDHTCAIKDGGVWCWGENTYGQLGNNSTTMSNVPVQVSGMESSVSMIAAGGRQTCAIKTDGSIWCWGNASSGYLGTGSTSDVLVPQPLTVQPGNAQSIYNGEYTFCVKTQDRRLWCWGGNGYGQFGNGVTGSSKTPVLVAGGMTVSQWTEGRYHLCARKEDGSAWCWGYNSKGRLGNGNTTHQSSPVQVTDMASGVLNIVAGFSHTCAITQ